ncbi:MAG: isoprenylcysteine carboxylmethyltransferase family protein [candidate division KSB1 bacterium]|nr:isoprenylcysteine carboxylmethyltransferase family protein [candidate division KSB1 bacterium]MDZ7288170.1 isoprenylcysteine carboxylmethyltransferase family protein [candidate division KSB1 bacterium]MDZ7300317.1 isoprenylcysteine carboxylmethyltransferase family protein [candidate division KSB1 bacterium]MDZ7308677.1 isoprenylcysteine carboxylmethyltransferase family protein [candidate division KSB1 bacterium]MDZ7351317.1 isoprenylcysteine carboxylmethyltransferase family protein [candidat
MNASSFTSKIITYLGWLAIVFFVAIYGIELIPHHGPPVTVRWLRETFGQAGLIVLNILIVLAFLALLPYRRPTKHFWKSQGAFIAFVIALMTEMFGWPLVLFLVSPFFDIPIIAPKYFGSLGHSPATVGTAISIAGVVLIAAGWRQIHRSEGLITSGLYRYIRHPQYTGILLFTFGWLLHWPSAVTLILWPVLVMAYTWLAKQEEKQALEEFGARYTEYARQTKRFIPFLI